MHHGAKAYGAVAIQTANPRDREADLLLDAAARLQQIQDSWESRLGDLDSALLNNRKLWTIFMSSAASPENPLPAGVRQNVVNLGIFVLKQTIATLANPTPANLRPLININRELAAGLLNRAA